MRFPVSLLICSCLVWVLAAASSSAQTAPVCGAAPSILKVAQPNIFSDQQEQWLGDAMADLTERYYRTVQDPEQNAYLERIADRLLAVLPPTQLKFRLLLIDSPEVNGISLAGGRIYLTRKLVANANSEDEVAAVIGHEMGHILTHQVAIEITAQFKRLLNITSVGDRADVYAKFLQLTDRLERDTHASNSNSDEKQDIADRVAVFAVAAAGYRPQSYAEFWNRSFFVGGKVGNRFGDFFGVTKPTEKRLRSMQAMTALLPPGCGIKGSGNQAKAIANEEAFQLWRKTVVANRSASTGEVSLPLSEVHLSPPLRLSVQRLRFSPNGKYLLAQDESSVSVLTREPFEQILRLDAEGATQASFSPDSSAVVFSTPGLHVERWNIADRRMSAAYELNPPRPCLQSMLAPDGRTVFCVGWSETGLSFDLDLLDVETGRMVYEVKSWFQPTLTAMLLLSVQARLGVDSGFFPRAFSQDGNTLVLGPGNQKLAFDLRTRMPIKLGGDFKADIDSSYAFQGSGTIAGVNQQDVKRSGLFSFPEGKAVLQRRMAFNNMEAVSNGQYVLVRDVKDMAVGVADLRKGEFVAGSKQPAIDVWESTLVGEGGDGSLRLSAFTPTGVVAGAGLQLPLSPLGVAQSVSMSPDGHYLAFSAGNRGAIWDATTGKQMMLVRAFHGGAWTPDNIFYAAFEDEGAKTSHVLEVRMDTKVARRLPYILPAGTGFAEGQPYEWKSEKENRSLVTHSVQDNAVLWTRSFSTPEVGLTTNSTDGDTIFSLRLDSSDAKRALQGSAALAAQASKVKHKESGRLVQIVSRQNGVTKQQVVVEVPASYRNANGYNFVGDLLYLWVGDNRTVVYSVQTGEQVRQLVGSLLASDGRSGRVCIGNRKGEVAVYTPDGAEVSHLQLGVAARVSKFLNGGSKLAILTADQRVRMYELPVVTAMQSTK